MRIIEHFPWNILGQTMNCNVEASRVHHSNLCGVGCSVGAHEKYLQKKSWTHSEIQYLPSLLMINFFSSSINKLMISFWMHDLTSSSFVIQIAGK